MATLATSSDAHAGRVSDFAAAVSAINITGWQRVQKPAGRRERDDDDIDYGVA